MSKSVDPQPQGNKSDWQLIRTALPRAFRMVVLERATRVSCFTYFPLPERNRYHLRPHLPFCLRSYPASGEELIFQRVQGWGQRTGVAVRRSLNKIVWTMKVYPEKQKQREAFSRREGFDKGTLAFEHPSQVC